jgi:hypothetical protein
LVLKVAYFHYFVVLEHIIALLVDLVPSLVFAPLLLLGLEIFASSWAIFGALPHLTSSFALERYVVLGWT